MESRLMENLSEVSAYVASALVLFTFIAKDMSGCHQSSSALVLLPVNIVRLSEVIRTDKFADRTSHTAASSFL
jgi:hypothetical protein